MTFSFVLISTLAETGVGLVHAFNERITRHRVNKVSCSHGQYAAVGALLMIVYGLSQFGLVNLIVQGYGLLTWIMLGVFILPLLTRGIVKIRNSNSFLGA